TRFSRDWSSDVCSSDLDERDLLGHLSAAALCLAGPWAAVRRDPRRALLLDRNDGRACARASRDDRTPAAGGGGDPVRDGGDVSRSEERRVGKEWKAGGL